MTDDFQLPPTTCVYGRYDTLTLTPETPETESRLRELGWTSEDFRGQTVLDIGCNSGILSIYALQLGAKSVKAVDPTQQSVEIFSKVVSRHRRLAATVQCADLSRLVPERDRADVVLFMEVMHWAVDQGMPVPEVINRLWQMTRKTLFLEFPWSVDEPSIQAQTKLTAETYSASLILEELGKAFANVRIVGFMHYFGILSTAKRVLVRATQPRREYVFTSTQQNTFSVAALGERASTYIAPLISPAGMLILKQFSPHSCLNHLSMENATALISALANVKPECLVVPTAVQGQYLLEQAGIRSSVFPMIVRKRINLKEFCGISEPDLVTAAVGLRRDLRGLQIPPTLRAEESLSRSLGLDEAPFDLQQIAGQTVPDPLLADMLAIGIESYHIEATEICHCDLQEGNVIIALDGSVRVVDLDGLAFGTAFTDGLCAMIWIGASPEGFETITAALEAEERRRATLTDCGIAFMIIAHWFNAVLAVNTEEAAANAQRARRGLSSLVTWWLGRTF